MRGGNECVSEGVNSPTNSELCNELNVYQVYFFSPRCVSPVHSEERTKTSGLADELRVVLRVLTFFRAVKIRVKEYDWN